MDSTAAQLREAAERMLNAQRVVTSGKKITKPSDDPTLANRSMSLRCGINGIAQYQENNNLAKSSIDFAEATVGDIAKELKLLQAQANKVTATLSDESRQAMLSEIEDIRQRLLGLAGTKYLDKYIFSGTAINTTPIVANPADPAIPPYLYQGDAGIVQLRVQEDEKIQLNVSASEIFNLDGSAGAGVADVFTVIDQLETCVKAGDVQGASDLVTDIGALHSNVLGLQAELGSRSARLEDNATALTDMSNRMKELLSNLEDADLPSAIIDLQTQQNVYQAALAVTSQLMQRSLADYLS